MKEFLKSNYGFSDYQVAQLSHLGKTLLSEFSKLLFMGICFYDILDVYAVAVGILLLLRTSTGGYHCKTYLTCLLSSFLYMLLCIRFLPLIHIPTGLRFPLLFLCMIINYCFGPVTSDVHVPLSEERIKKGRLRALIIILLFFIISSIIPDNKYMPICFWIIVVHTLQLIFAKIRKKGEQT
ncbi:MAG: accessory gene regulator B family protein [Lachnospiraceae bacterium]|nr:accessory gene regulator B family protein [Lachnospiraceae bacterium]